MKYRTSIALISVAICAQFANADPQTEQIRKLAAENSAALTSGNYARLVELTYPKVVEMIGDKNLQYFAARSVRRQLEQQAFLGVAGGETETDKPSAAMHSPNYATATRPVHAKSVSRWRHYEERLKSGAKFLHPFITEFGYQAG